MKPRGVKRWNHNHPPEACAWAVESFLDSLTQGGDEGTGWATHDAKKARQALGHMRSLILRFGISNQKTFKNWRWNASHAAVKAAAAKPAGPKDVAAYKAAMLLLAKDAARKEGKA